jgi:hypothetical protein
MEKQDAAGRVDNVGLATWIQWQHAVLALLRTDVIGVLRSIEFDEVDWDAWRAFFTEGLSPRLAVDRALARDF